MAEESKGEEMTPQKRYYLLHHQERLARAREKYNQRPDVIAKREEKDRIRAEKGQKSNAEKIAERERKRIEKAAQLEEKKAAALVTKRKTAKTSDSE